MTDTIPQHLEKAAAGWMDKVALREPRGSSVEETTYEELFRAVRSFGRGLIAAGVEPGDRVFLLADNCARWLIADLGILWAGAVSVPRGADTTEMEAEYILRHSGAKAVVAQAPEHLDLLPGSGGELGVRVLITGEREGALAFEELIGIGEASEEPGRENDVATIVYTSGTTGDPKGVVLTHANILHNVRALPPLLKIDPGVRFLCVLPSWHMFERTAEHAALACGGVLSYSGLRTLKQDMAREEPHFLVAVPRLWEGLEGAFRAKVEKKGAVGRAIAKFLSARAIHWSRNRSRAKRLIVEDQPRGGMKSLWDRLCFVFGAPLGALGCRVVGGQIRKALGGRLMVGVSGGSHMPLHLDCFLSAMGITLITGYGLTETSPVITVRLPEANVLGTMGKPLAEVEARVVDPTGRELPAGEVGELEVRGPNVMKGYYRNEEATSAVLSEDGWFRTGDLVHEAIGGNFVFRGRIKDTIVLAGGENVEPGPIETAILQSPYVRQTIVVGHDKKTLGALVVPETELAGADAAGRGIPVEELVRSEIRRLVSARAGFKARERIGRVAILNTEFTVADGTLTRTLKLRRNIILERYRDLIDSLYR